MSTVAVIDYGLCNLHSVASGVEKCGHTAVITDRAEDMRDATHLILPGVGSFSDAMKNIRDRKIDTALQELVTEKDYPLLGICLGMQLLMESGSEGGTTEGLGLIPGTVEKLQPQDKNERIPHIGWNEVHIERDSLLLTEIPSDHDFYFVHSYHTVCSTEEHIIATTPYCGSFASIIENENVFGTQFHPEKSQKLGLQLLKNFLTLC